MIRYAGHLGSSVLELAKASRLPPPYGYSSLWESRVNPSTQLPIIDLRTVRTTWPSRRETRNGSACASDSSLYPAPSIVTRLIIHTCAGFVHVTTLLVSTLKGTREWFAVWCDDVIFSRELKSANSYGISKLRVNQRLNSSAFSSVCYVLFIPRVYLILSRKCFQ